MPQNPYREPFQLDTALQTTVEKEVAECLKAMSQYKKIPEGELVNTALRRFIATHSDDIPKTFKLKK